MPQMIIANRLRDGAVVFLAANEGWETAIAEGTVIDSEADAFGPTIRTDLTEV